MFMTKLAFLYAILAITSVGFFIWIWRKGREQIEEFPDFTAPERAALQRQMNTLLGFPVLALVVCVFSVSFEPRQWPPYAGLIAMALFAGPVGYICVSSIRDRVSLIRDQRRLPLKGEAAVRIGVTLLVFLIPTFFAFIWLTLFSK
jgi:hypothetical protein